ncbi:hypothetical protein D3C84_252610 [compost metagenome]
MQAQHGHHEAAVGRRHLDRVAGARVEHEGVGAIGLGTGRGGHDGQHTVGFVRVPTQVLHDFTGPMGLGPKQQLRQIQVRGVFGHLLEYGRVAQQVIDLVMEDQRQAGHCQHQQEQGADQAGPGVDKRPAADGGAFHCMPLNKTRAVIV